MKTQQREPEPRSEAGANYLEMAIAFIALVPELFLHDPRTFGVRSVQPRGGGAVLAVYVFGLFFAHDNTNPLLILALVTAILALTAYLCAALRSQQGPVVHSFYNGRPWMARLFPMSEDRAKRMEPLLLVVAGFTLIGWNGPLASFVITAGACHGFRVIVGYLLNRTRVLDLNDAIAEQSVAMQALKRRRRR